MKIVVLSDTHAPRRWKTVPAALISPLQAADAILHAGDVCTPEVLDELAVFAPVHVAMGNNDRWDIHRWGARDIVELELAGVRLAMLHDSGPSPGRAQRMRSQFPKADIVIFGHSHIPWNTNDDGQRLLNPGSVTDPRREPQGSYAILDLRDGRIESCDIQLLPPKTQ